MPAPNLFARLLACVLLAGTAFASGCGGDGGGSGQWQWPAQDFGPGGAALPQADGSSGGPRGDVRGDAGGGAADTWTPPQTDTPIADPGTITPAQDPGSSTTTPDAPAADTATDPPPPPPCANLGFTSQAETWSLPYPLLTLGGADYNQVGNRQHALLDLDGDGDPDFVVIRDEEREQGDPLVGKNHWLVFQNTGSGFSPQPTPWALPYPLLPTGGGDFNQQSNGQHTLADLDGDGRTDFVQLEDEGEQTDALLGKNHWRVYPNTGAGFASQPVLWALPFPLVSEHDDFNLFGTHAHVLLDLDGGARVDFVMVRDEERGPQARDPLVGKNHWLVFQNTGSGFASASAGWSLPYPLFPPAGGDFDRTATTGHGLVDLDGDSLTDFVVNRDVERASPDTLVGKNHWLLFRNTGSGFATAPEQWGLPYPLIGEGGDDSDLGNGSHVLLTLTRDTAPDFVVIRDDERATSDPLVGKSHWLAFRNTGAGFGSSPEPAALPYPLVTTGGADFNRLATQRHALLDLDGDGLVDFIELEDGERTGSDPLAGKNHWRVYPNLCP